MHVRVQKCGKILAFRIPKPLAEDADVKEGTVLNLAVSEGKVVATPVERKKLSLQQLLAKVTRKNLHAEVDFGGDHCARQQSTQLIQSAPASARTHKQFCSIRS